MPQRVPRLEVWVASALSGALALFVLAPIVVVVLGAFLPASALGLTNDQWSGAAGARYSLDAFGYMYRNYATWLVMSARIALQVIAAGLLIAVPAGYAFVRYPFPGSRLLEEIVILPLSLPGIAVSVALLAAYPSARGSTLVTAGHLLYTLPFFVRAVTTTLRTRDIVELEAAARTLGASFSQCIRWIVLPTLRPALVLGSLIAFTVSWGEFNVSYLLNSGEPQTFPAALYNTYANESFHRSSAATAIFLAGALPALIAIQWLGGFGSSDVERGA